MLSPSGQAWIASLGERLAYLVHRACSRGVSWRTRSADRRQPPGSLFEDLQHVLRLASECPPGPAGDDIRRGACELIEADSAAARNTGRNRILNAIALVEWRTVRGCRRADDPSPLILRPLTDALQQALRLQHAPDNGTNDRPR